MNILKEIRLIPRIMRFKSKQPPPPKPQQVLIFDAEEGITEKWGDSVGRPWLLKGKVVYLAKHKEDKLVPYDPLQEWRTAKRIGQARSPEALYDAITWPEIKGGLSPGE